MFTHSLILFFVAINANAQTVTIECPGISCRSRFSESLQEHIVNKYEWVHSVRITYPAVVAENGNQPDSNWGDTARLVFKIEPERSPRELAKVLVESGYYYGTESWTLIERTRFSDLK